MNRIISKYRTTPNLSSDSLFHLTNDFGILKLILEKGFQVRFIYEKLPGRKLAYLTKTICFCDIPLSMIKEHFNWYGTYGIGIKRPIAKKAGFSPVIYMHSKSPSFPKGSSSYSKAWFENFEFTRCLKQVRGQQMFFDDKGEPIYRWKTFYNEREWRYFPPDKKIEVLPYHDEMELENRRTKLNKSSLPLLDFDVDWIEYILINDITELDQLTRILKGPRYIKNYDLLLTKVVTFKQIRKDF